VVINQHTRVSTEEQTEGYSIEAQLRACRTLAQDKGWTVVAEYIDGGKSARSEDISKRPKFKEMLEAAKRREFDVLVVHKLDRFARNLLTMLKCFDDLSQSGITFISVSEQIDYTTPMGRVFLAMSGAFAQFYSDNLSQGDQERLVRTKSTRAILWSSALWSDEERGRSSNTGSEYIPRISHGI
jgi:site-specific DNA recombinase